MFYTFQILIGNTVIQSSASAFRTTSTNLRKKCRLICVQDENSEQSYKTNAKQKVTSNFAYIDS